MWNVIIVSKKCCQSGSTFLATAFRTERSRNGFWQESGIRGISAIRKFERSSFRSVKGDHNFQLSIHFLPLVFKLLWKCADRIPESIPCYERPGSPFWLHLVLLESMRHRELLWLGAILMDRRCTSFAPKPVPRCSMFLGRSQHMPLIPRDDLNQLYGNSQDELEVDEIGGPESTSTTGRTRWKPPKLVLQIIDVCSMVFSYTMTFLGTLLTLGLVLNLCGYAYTFTWTNGVRIDTIQQTRNEIQFENEIRRMSRDNYRSTLPQWSARSRWQS